MTIDHRAEAEKYLVEADSEFMDREGDPTYAVAAALVHATLARDEEQAASRADMQDANTLLRQQLAILRRAVVDHVADGLAANDRIRWQTARDLATALDTVGHNIDKAVDERLENLLIDSRAAWEGPSGVAGPVLTKAQARDMHKVIARRIAEALVEDSPRGANSWARGIAYSLDGVGVNIDAEIEARVQEITPGTPPVQASFMPF